MNKIPASSFTGLANHLVFDGLLDPNTAIYALQEAKKVELPLISYLVKNAILSSEIIFQSCNKAFGLPIFDLAEYDLTWLDNCSEEWIKRYRIIPLKKINNTLQVALSDPTDRQVLDILTFHTGLILFPFLVSEEKLDQFINHHFNNAHTNRILELSLLKELVPEDNSTAIQEQSIHYNEPVIRFVDHMIEHALQQSASDIHIEPYENNCRIRYRQDGILYKTTEIPINLATRLATRLKVMAKLDISERRLPQDGRFQLHHVDIRINICPTLFGEKIVLRLLDIKKASLAINELGLSDQQYRIFLNGISQSQGLILVTGPTGSGKTITLYSALHYLNTPEKNISTVEDPVEIQLNGINQININSKINLHFSTILRTLLRQDPDIMMVGEIRDSETADIAIQAAQTGHLVLSTLHTNSAIEAISRLQSMNIVPYNMISSITFIIAQRLIRKLCIHCKQPDAISDTLIKNIVNHDNVQTFRSVGCANCFNGYQGRTGIYEILVMTDNLAHLILKKTDSITLLTEAKKEGYITLREHGLQKVAQGLTSLVEINRVTLK